MKSIKETTYALDQNNELWAWGKSIDQMSNDYGESRRDICRNELFEESKNAEWQKPQKIKWFRKNALEIVKFDSNDIFALIMARNKQK